MGFEIINIEKWIYEVVQADTVINQYISGRAFSRVIPTDTPYPLLRYTHMSSTDKRGPGATRIFVTSIFQIKCISDMNDNLYLEGIVDCIDRLFDIGSVQIIYNSTEIIGCHRLTAIAYAEEAQNRQYEHVGGTFRIYSRRVTPGGP